MKIKKRRFEQKRSPSIQEKARAAGACDGCKYEGTGDCAWSCNYVDARKVDRFPAMTLEEIKRRLKKIENSRHDEEQHADRDDLCLDFIKYISTYESAPEIQEMAREILKVEDMDFAVWYS